MKALIMAGGRGTRFWPLSRERHPKQFLRITGQRTLFQEAVYRLLPYLDVSDVYVVCGQQYAEQALEQVPELTQEQVIVEPAARNTAPCIGLAASYLKQRYPNEVMAVLPADHVISDEVGFHRALAVADTLAREGWLITFGIKPTYAATGYGYVERAGAIGEGLGQEAYRVARFIEKPDRETAQQFMANPSFSWNSGMFVWTIDGILAEIDQVMPELGAALKEIERNVGDEERIRTIFGGIPKTSIDYGVMEKTERAGVIPCDFGWSDVGSWKALKDLTESDAAGIISEGPYEAIQSVDCIISAPPSKLVALVGMNDVVVVDTEEVLLICSGEHTEDVKKVVEKLKEEGLDKYL